MNIEKVFSVLKRTGKISYRQLYVYGLTDEDIEGLVESGILKEIENHEYKVDSVDELVHFGRYLLGIKQYKEANSAFICAYTLEPTNLLANFQLLYRNLLNAKPEYMFNHFDVVYNGLKDRGKESDANFYLFVLGNLYDLPEKYEKIFDNMKVEDMLIGLTDIDSFYQDEFRKKIFENSYSRVNGMLDDRFGELESNSLSAVEKFEKELGLKWLVKHRALHKKIMELLVTDDIVQLKKVLEDADRHRFLSVSNQYLLKLVNKYIEFEHAGIKPEVTGNGYDVYKAIDNNNYDLAMKLLNEQEGLSADKTSYLLIMLKKMIELINKDSKKFESAIESVAEVREKAEARKDIVLTDKEKQALKSKIEQLYAGRSIFLLEPMPKEKRDMVRGFVGTFKDIVSFSIGVEPERRVVLRYRPIVKEYVDILEVFQEAKKLYRRGKFEDAAKKYELLLKLGKPRDIVYGMYGLTLLQMHRRKESLDYLKVATIMSKEKDGPLDYSDLIYELENPHDANKKPRVDIKESEFVEASKVVLDDELLNDLIGLTQEGEISLIDACKKLNISEVDTNYARLLYARDCYYKGDYERGDIYLKQVEKSKDKDKRVKDLYKEIQLNRKYYVHRLDAEKKQLIFLKK